MTHPIEAISTAAAVFTSSNLDDIFLLVALFSDPKLRPRQVVLGQYLGIALLFVGSTVCALAALAVPEAWLGLLGIGPLWLGVSRLRALWRNENEETASAEPSSRWAQLPALAVATLTVANGGDNLGIYIPVFATRPRQLPIFAVVFAALVGVWCALAYGLTRHPRIGKHIQRYGRAALPFVLIALGLWILSRSLPLLRGH